MATNPRKGISGYIVKTGSGGDWVKRNSGVIVTSTGGNLNTQIPNYGSPSLDYSQPKKTNLVGDIVSPAR